MQVELTKQHMAFKTHYKFPDSEPGWKKTGSGDGLTMLLGLDCEMVETTNSTSELARVTVTEEP